jgi:hypothetical protein
MEFQTNLEWVGMAHQWCINNWLILLILVVCRFIVGSGYYKFVTINGRIIEAKKKHGKHETDDTFKWFKWVFITCGTARFVSLLTLFIGLYWISAIIEILNAYAIINANRVYSKHEEAFKEKPITTEDIYRAQKAGASTMFDDILKLDLTPDALEKVRRLKNK